MILPPLFKYLDVRGAALTLVNGTFKHAKPSDFNDLQDLTAKSVFPGNTATALQEIKDGFIDVILKNLDKRPTCINKQMREQVTLIQYAFKKDPDAAKTTLEILQNDPLSDLYDLGELEKHNAAYIEEINEHMQSFRVFCVTDDLHSKDMWDRYAQNGQGIALRIKPNAAKDSKFTLFRKVNYRDTRPPLFKNALSFLESSMFGNHEERIREIVDEIIYTKTREWEYESEYRLAIPIVNEPDWNTMPYHAEEISEIYFGPNASEDTKNVILQVAQLRNPAIKTYYGCLGPDGRLLFLP